MSTSTETRQADSLVGLAFPVIQVRYAGPTDRRGSRYIATLRGVRHTEHYDYALDASRNAYNAAVACWDKYRAALPLQAGIDDAPRVFVPGDLNDSTYAYTVVPTALLAPEVTEVATEAEPVKVTRQDYPNAPVRGDRYGWVIAAPSGGHMTEPYRDRNHAESLLDRYAPDARPVLVSLVWD